MSAEGAAAAASSVPAEPVVSTWRPGRPVDLGAVLGPLRRGGSDPTIRVGAGGTWRTARTPQGPATQLLRVVDDGVECRAWGPGAQWLVATVPELLGERDVTAADFVPLHNLVRAAWRRHPGWRVPRTGLVLESLVPAVLEQKVTGDEARRSWRRLLRDHGEPAPGPAPDGMRVVPEPRTWALLPSWTWHRSGVGPDRARTLVGVGARAAAVERTLTSSFVDADRALRSLPGIGAWTSAEVRQRAHGDPDAVSVGDFHLRAQVVYALTGRTGGDDDAMLELLEPYAGHRYRAVRMIELAGITAPRRGPRYAPLDHRDR